MDENNKVLYSNTFAVVYMAAIYFFALLLLLFSISRDGFARVFLIATALIGIVLTYRYFVVLEIYASKLRLWKPLTRNDIPFQEVKSIQEVLPGHWRMDFMSKKHKVYTYGFNRNIIEFLHDKLMLISFLSGNDYTK